MYSAWLMSTFRRVLKSLEIKEERPNFYISGRGYLTFGVNQLCRISELFGPPLLYFHLKSSTDQNFPSFIRFQSFLHESEVLFSKSWNFYKLKRRDLISWRTNFAERVNYLVPLLYFDLKSFLDPSSSSFIRFQCTLHDSWELFSECRDF